MFTGLVEDVGAVLESRPVGGGGGRQLTLRTRIPISQLQVGESIAVDGICLTAEGFGSDTFTVTAGRETLALTTAGDWQPGRRVNLERALRPSDRLGGHIVAGHIDGVGEVNRAEQRGESWLFWLTTPAALARYIATKGSVTIDGVSLTVNEVQGPSFRVNIIPHTLSATTFSELRPGRRVNLEVDLIARYVERLLQGGSDANLTIERLAKMGY